MPIISPILITSLSNNQHRSSLDSVQSTNLSDLVLGENYINRSRRSSSLSSIRTKRRVRFRSRDFIRPHSSTLIDLSSYVIGKSLPSRTNSLSARIHTEKSASKILDEKDEQQKPNLESFQSTSNKNEKKFITSHSMIITKNMRLPPTATVVINQTYKPSLITTTSSTNNQLRKATLSKDIVPSQRLLTARSIPDPFRKSTKISKPDFDLKITSFHHTDDENNSSNE
jgi:hypothetical protein